MEDILVYIFQFKYFCILLQSSCLFKRINSFLIHYSLVNIMNRQKMYQN